MRIATPLGYLLSGTATLAILAGCSGGGAQSPVGLTAGGSGASGQSLARSVATHPITMLAHPEFVRPGAQLILGDPDLQDAKSAKSSVYVGQFAAGENLYALPDTKNVAPKCSIAGSYVNGMGVNSAGVLYLPQGGTRTTTTYTKGSCTAAALVLGTPSGQPSDVAFDSKGTTYVSNIFGNSGASGNVDVYKKGATSPSSTLTDPNLYEVLGVAVDSKNNVYVSNLTSSSVNEVLEFAGGKMPAKVLGITGNSFIIGITFDDKENLLASDASAGAILVYAKPYSGAPKSTIATKGETIDIKLDSTNKNLYGGDYGNGAADVYSYPSGKYEYSITNGLSQGNQVEGIAVDPSDNN